MITVLCHVCCLQELNLSFGEITQEAALVVAQAVTDKPHMEKVDLNGTHTNCCRSSGCVKVDIPEKL